MVSHFRNLENTQKKIVTHRLHAQLTSEETQILEEFKAKNPIRTAETLQEIAAEKPAASPLGLEVGDVIRYDGKLYEYVSKMRKTIQMSKNIRSLLKQKVRKIQINTCLLF